MWVTAFFTTGSGLATGLSPIVNIRDLSDGSLVVDGEAMTEKGDGFYAYDFAAHDVSKDYTFLCDSVTLSGVERYAHGASGEYNDVLNTIDSTVGDVDIRTTLLKKIQTNRLELADGSTNNWILYDDDNSTPLLTFSVTDKDGSAITQYSATPSRRSKAT